MMTAAFGPWTRFQLRLVGIDLDLMHGGPDRDLTNAKTLSWLLIMVGLWQTTLFTAAAHVSLARPGELRPELILIGAGLSIIVLLIDSYLIMRGSWSLHGLKELARGGLVIPGLWLVQTKHALFTVLRAMISAAVATLMAVYCVMFILDGDIRSVLQSDYQQANAELITKITAQVDTSITALENDQRTVATLSAKAIGEEEALRRTSLDPVSAVPEVREAIAAVTAAARKKDEAEISLSAAQQFASDELAGIKGGEGNSGKRGSGPVRKAAQERVLNAQERLTVATREWETASQRLQSAREAAQGSAKERASQAAGQVDSTHANRSKLERRLFEIEAALDERRTNREAIIRTAVEADPSFEGAGTGFPARFQAMKRIAQADSDNFYLLLLIDAVLFCIDMAAVLVKTAAYIPSTYAIRLAAKDFEMAVTEASKLAEFMENLRKTRTASSDGTPSHRRDSDEEPPVPASAADKTDDKAEDLPRRRRGRPPRNGYRPDLSPPDGAPGDELNPTRA